VITKLQKKNKYGNTRATYKGMRFQSKGECNRYKELELLQLGGVITNLKRQVKHVLTSHGIAVGTYTSDFEYSSRDYVTVKGWRHVIEDFKGEKTELFKLKWALMKAEFLGTDVVLLLTSKNTRGCR
jgi:hypothetical protein